MVVACALQGQVGRAGKETSGRSTFCFYCGLCLLLCLEQRPQNLRTCVRKSPAATKSHPAGLS